MKKILNENQSDFKIKLGPELSSKKGIKYKKLYVAGNTYDLNKQLKSVGKSMKKEFGAGWDPEAKSWYFPVYQNKSTGEYDVESVKSRKVTPYLDKVNDFYKYTLDINELISKLEDYVPTGDPETATKEQADEVVRKLERFKEKLLNISSSEELQEIMRLMMDVKAGKAKYNFSPNNKIAIKTQRPDATIVCNRDNWKEWYNRTIKPDAKPIFVNAPLEKGFSKDIQRDYLQKLGKRYNELTGSEKAELYNLQGSREKTRAPRAFAYVANYDVKDTVQIPGTYDEIGAELEKAAKAKAELGDRTISGVDTDTQTTTDEKILTPVHNGLVAYADAQNIKDKISISNKINASSTKLLASALLTQILSGKLGGLASQSAVEAKSSAARRQQAEIASWQFMDAFGVDYNLSDIDMDVVFGSRTGNDYQKSKEKQRSRINSVLKDIENAVNHLVDFVNINIKDNANLSEIEGGLPQGKRVSVSSIAKDLGISDMLKEMDTQELYERLRKKLNLI